MSVLLPIVASSQVGLMSVSCLAYRLLRLITVIIVAVCYSGSLLHNPPCAQYGSRVHTSLHYSIKVYKRKHVLIKRKLIYIDIVKH